MFRKLLPLLGVLVLALSAVACTSASAASAASPGNSNADVATALSTDEANGLLHMREEEKLARDVYLALYDKWQAPVFQNIAHAEQMHMDAVGTLLSTYGLDDPVAKNNDAHGVFSDPDLQALYDKLMNRGSASLVDAYTVGATIEDLDIKDLDDALARTNHADIRQVYENLKMGSENHMRAFVTNLKAQGASYSPQYLSDAEFQQILEGTMGRGRGRGNTQGTFAGQGFRGGQNGQGRGQGSNAQGNFAGQGFGRRQGRQGQGRGHGINCPSASTP